MTYVKTGPFVAGGAPGISNTFLNNVENFLVTVNSAATDSNVTADGSGDLTVVKTLFTNGSIKRMGKATGSGTQTITHNWGEKADIVLPYYNGAFGTAPTQAFAVTAEGVNSFQVVGQSAYSWSVLYIKF